MPTLQTPEAFLRSTHRESLPEWLEAYRPGDGFNQQAFFGSRVVFYPGAGEDGHAVKVFASSHSAHCFVHADYWVSEASIVESLDRPSTAFRGYQSLDRLPLRLENLATPWTPRNWDEQWLSRLPRELVAEVCRGLDWHRVESYGSLEVLERKSHLGDDHGPARIAILFLGADGHATYDALFCQEGQTAPFAVLLHDHGFGGNYSSWGSGGLLEAIAFATRRLPQFLLIADGESRPWKSYVQLRGLSATLGGMYNSRRYLHAQSDSAVPSHREDLSPREPSSL